MDAELKRLHSPDIYDLENYQPDDSEEFGFLLQAMVGPKGKDGEESFDINVCTPKWLKENNGRSSIIIGRHYLIVGEYNYKSISEFIQGYLRTCSGDSWSEVAEKVSRLGKWEFEDYDG